MDRRKQILKKIDINKGVGLELGPLHLPILKKEEANVKYVDHMSSEDLRIKYQGHDLVTENIIEVDYVLGNKSLKEVVGNKKFDYIVASHVIEHIPNIVSWLEEIASVLKQGGILSLVIPDMRFTFDIARWPSRASEVIGSYLDSVTKSTSSMIYDAKSEYKETTPQRAWIGLVDDVLVIPKAKQLKEAMRSCELNLQHGSYVDAHCYTFTPSSFIEILRQLMLHELIDFEVAYFKETSMNELEFFVSLRRINGRRSANSQIKTLPKIKPQQKYVSLLLENESMRLENLKLQEKLDSMEQSNSWKTTKPLRKASEICRVIISRVKS